MGERGGVQRGEDVGEGHPAEVVDFRGLRGEVGEGARAVEGVDGGHLEVVVRDVPEGGAGVDGAAAEGEEVGEGGGDAEFFPEFAQGGGNPVGARRDVAGGGDVVAGGVGVLLRGAELEEIGRAHV